MQIPKSVLNFVLLPILLLSGVAHAGGFNCGNLSGNFECRPLGESASFIEFEKNAITITDKSDFPLTLEVDRKSEASTELEHVAYTAHCKKSAIEVKSKVTPLNGGPAIQMNTIYKINKDGDLITETTINGQQKTGSIQRLCGRI
jgi:hypothetical protein